MVFERVIGNRLTHKVLSDNETSLGTSLVFQQLQSQMHVGRPNVEA